jgi:hypothetical protein
VKRAAPEGNGSRHPQPIVAKPDDDERIVAMQASAEYAGMTHISTLIAVEVERLTTLPAKDGS